jgi:hypothetical protein
MAAIRSLGIDLPEEVMNKVAACFEGMTPMERYVTKTMAPQGERESAEVGLPASQHNQ